MNLKNNIIKSSLIFLLSLLLQFSGFCQKVEEIATPYPEFIGAFRHYFYEDSITHVVKLNTDQVALLKFDSESFTVKKDVREKLKWKRSADPIAVVKLKDKCFAFYVNWNRKEKAEELFAFEIDYRNDKIVLPEQKVSSFQGETLSYGFNHKYKFVSSEDGSKLLVYCSRLNEKKDASKVKDVYGIFSFDQNLNPLINKEFESPYFRNVAIFKDFYIQNNGTVSMLLSKNDNQVGEILQFKQGEDSPQKIEVQNVSHWDNPYHFHANSKDELLIVGYTTKKEKTLFLYNCKTKEKEVYPIPNNVINHFGEPLNDVPIEALECHNHVDGSITILANRRPKTEYADIYRFLGGKKYFHHDFILSKIKSDNTLDWMTLLPRRFDSPIYLPRPVFNYEFRNGKHYVVFLASKKNEQKSLNEIPFPFSGFDEQAIFAYEVDNKKGSTKRYTLMSVKMRNISPMWYIPACDVTLSRERTFLKEKHHGGDQDILLRIQF